MTEATNGITAARLGLLTARWKSRRTDLLMWGAVPGVAAVVRYQPRFLPQFDLGRLAAAIVALGLVIACARRPDRAVVALIVILPFQMFASSWLYAHGVPISLLKNLGYWKEAAVLGLVIVARRGFRARGRRLDSIDVIGMLFVGFSALYAFFPRLFAPDAPNDSTLLYLGFRQFCGFVILFLACRHVQFPKGTIDRVVRGAIIVASATATIAIYEFVFSDSWNSFVVDTIQAPRWLSAIDVYIHPYDIRGYSELGGHKILRVGSVFLAPLFFCFFLLPGFSLLLGRLGRSVGRAGAVVAIGVVGAAVVLTSTRSAVLGGLVILVLTLRADPGRFASAKARLALVACAGLLIAVPAAAASGLGGRISGAATGSEEGASVHWERFQDGVERLVDEPLGAGLGTSAGAGIRLAEDRVSAENYYIQIGNEIGVVPMLLFGAFAVIVPRRLLQRAGHDAMTAAVGRSLVGLGIAAFLLHAWVDLNVALTAWGLAGVALSHAESVGADEPSAAEVLARPTISGSP